jgi:DNA-binding MarR family transcriptional regulator
MQRLEASGWVERQVSPEDARSKLVKLTPAGLELIDRAVKAHVQNEHRILAPLSAADLSALEASLAQLLAVLEPGGE